LTPSHRKPLRVIGNSKGVILPAEFLHELGWEQGDQLEIRREGSELVLARAPGYRRAQRRG
jgi:antitoxin component of MazEF toxin-antitoxin module